MNWTRFNYSNEGERSSIDKVDAAALTPDSVTAIGTRLEFLSGNLQLPLQVSFAGEHARITAEVYSESTAAYSIYHLDGSPVAAALVMAGANLEEETSVQDLFRYLLLEEGDHPEPDPEHIEQLLLSDEYDFETDFVEQFPDSTGEGTDQPPASFFIPLEEFASPEDQSLIDTVDRELSAALLGRMAGDA